MNMGIQELLPVGLGLFFRNMPRSQVETRVKRVVDNGITFVAIPGPWYDIDPKTKKPVQKWINKPTEAQYIMEICDKHGLKTFAWGYPMNGFETSFALDIHCCTIPATIGVLPDPELRSKGKDENRDGRVDEAEMRKAYLSNRALYWELTKQNPYWVIGFTSYGLIRQHPTLPWSAFAIPGEFDPINECHFASPQLYDEELTDMEKSMRQYTDIGFDHLIPAYGTYKFSTNASGKRITPSMTETELDRHLTRLESLRPTYKFNAIIGWSEAQVTAGGWRALSRHASNWVL